MKIFISSTYQDLKNQRALVIDYFRQFEACIDVMEAWSSFDDSPIDYCLKKVKEADLFIGIYGNRYGFVDPDSGKSITELEYIEARDNNVHRLVFITSDDNDCDELEKFKEYAKSEQIVAFVQNDSDLINKVDIAFKDFADEKGLDLPVFNKEEIFDQIKAVVGGMPIDLRLSLDNIEYPSKLIDELYDEIQGLEYFYETIQNSYNKLGEDLDYILSLFNHSEHELSEKISYYENPFAQRDWEWITFFPNRINELKKIYLALRLHVLYIKAKEVIWTKELSTEILNSLSVLKTHIRDIGLID
jgi:hypothetical protein